MTRPLPLLSRFRILRPRFEIRQERSLEWLVEAHVRAEETATGGALDTARFRERMAKVVARCACGPAQIERRGHAVPDCGHVEWEKMELYDVTRSPRGAPTSARTAFYETAAAELFQRAFDAGEAPPGDIVHVTCTGYASPSAAQRLVAEREWGATTRVTHAYHMGCYAAVPAIRIASGLASLPTSLVSSPAPGAPRVEVVHTELCSLHLDPSVHTPEAFVVQSLFADGAIRYSVACEDAPGLRVLAVREAILGGSTASMRWVVGDAGMQMTLAKDVPERIRGALSPFLRAMFAQVGLDFAVERGRPTYAVHPGGPKILDGVRDALELDEAKLAESRGVLRDFGNMSSATLPHVWARLLDSPACSAGSLIVSLAFGPGLTVCGALLRKE